MSWLFLVVVWFLFINLVSILHKVSWIRHRDLHLLTVGKETYTPDQRFQSVHNPHTDDWSLKVKTAMSYIMLSKMLIVPSCCCLIHISKAFVYHFNILLTLHVVLGFFLSHSLSFSFMLCMLHFIHNV